LRFLQVLLRLKSWIFKELDHSTVTSGKYSRKRREFIAMSTGLARTRVSSRKLSKTENTKAPPHQRLKHE
jgi:hypothetical protein